MVTSAAVSIDYRKTFDTVNHILLRKLEVYDLNPHALQWFASYTLRIDSSMSVSMDILRQRYLYLLVYHRGLCCAPYCF